MIRAGLSTAQQRDLNKLLRGPHWIRVTVQLLDLNHRYLGDMSNRLMSGQIDVDNTQSPSRSLQLNLLDPNSRLSINPDAPEDGVLFMNRMVKVIYSVAPPSPTYWYHIPVFVGPITEVSRDSISVTVTAKGKEILGYASVWRTRTYKKGYAVTSLIYDILKNQLGESKLAIPSDPRKLSKNVPFTVDSVPWEVAKGWGATLGKQLYYDGYGQAVLRVPPRTTSVVFDDSIITERPKFTYDPSTIYNRIVVTGATPKGKKKKPVTGSATAPSSHPLSPQRLGRNGVPRYYTNYITDESLTTNAACAAAARRYLASALLEAINAEFDTLPYPQLEENDIILVRTDDVSLTVRAVQWSLPLTHDGTMSHGVNRRVTPRR